MFGVGRIDRMRRLLALCGLALLGCGEQPPTAPERGSAGDAGNLLFASKPKLVECESTESLSQTLTIGSVGGTISIEGTSVVFPAGVLDDETTVTLTIPASPYLEVDIQTSGRNDFRDLELLKQPSVTISYARCDRNDLRFKLLSAWYINSEKELVDPMPSVDNKLTRSVTFPAEHFSGYAIAF